MLVVSALRFSSSAGLIAPGCTDSCSATLAHSRPPSRGTSMRSRGTRGCCCEEDVPEAQVTGVSCVFREPWALPLPPGSSDLGDRGTTQACVPAGVSQRAQPFIKRLTQPSGASLQAWCRGWHPLLSVTSLPCDCLPDPPQIPTV